jgi:hypothetical protein
VLTTDLVTEIERQRKMLMLSLVETPRKTLEDYHGVVGQCQGLQAALDVINNLLEQEDDDSGRNQRSRDRNSHYG